VNRIEKKFEELKTLNKKAFIAYICAGDPDIATTKKLVFELEKSGADIIELGIPFSDPLADGPTIQRASHRALKKGINISGILSAIKSLRKKTQIPIVLMGYYNPILHYGLKRFTKDVSRAGVDGIIIPDLIPEEADELIHSARGSSLCTIFLAAVTSSAKRLRSIAQKSTGFIYYVSLTGVTGVRQVLPSHIKCHINQIKRISKKPVCVGFGVSNPKQVAALNHYCDGVIVGSAIINNIEKGLPDKGKAIRMAGDFVKNIIKEAGR